MTTQPLTHDEIRTLGMLTDQFQAAQVRAQMAGELNQQYQAILRQKYGLDDSWHCLDVLVGFEKVEGTHDGNDND